MASPAVALSVERFFASGSVLASNASSLDGNVAEEGLFDVTIRP